MFPKIYSPHGPIFSARVCFVTVIAIHSSVRKDLSLPVYGKKFPVCVCVCVCVGGGLTLDDTMEIKSI